MIFLIFFLTSCNSKSEFSEPEQVEGLFYYNSLSYKEQVLYNEISKKAKQYEKITSKINFNYTSENITNVLKALTSDDIELFYLDTKRINLINFKKNSSVNLFYLCNEDEIGLILNDYLLSLKETTPDIDNNMSIIDKEIFIHDYIIKNFKLDNSVEYTMFEFLKTKTGNSSHYALLFKYLCNQYGISCDIIHGSAKNQATVFNIIDINGVYYYTDVSWDDGDISFIDGFISHAYFNISRSKISRDHQFDDLYLAIDTQTENDYFLYKNLYTDKKETAILIIEREINSMIPEKRELLEIYCDISDDDLYLALEEAVKQINEDAGADIIRNQFRTFNTSNNLNSKVIQIFYN